MVRYQVSASGSDLIALCHESDGILAQAISDGQASKRGFWRLFGADEARLVANLRRNYITQWYQYRPI